MWQGWGYPGYMGGHDGMGWYLGMGLHGLFWLVVLVVLVVAGVALARYLWHGGAPPPSGDRAGGPGSALALLEERYARGEIDRDEFLQKKKDLGG